MGIKKYQKILNSFRLTQISFSAKVSWIAPNQQRALKWISPRSKKSASSAMVMATTNSLEIKCNLS